MARLFFAIWPPLATASALHRWAGRVQRDAGGRAVSAAAIHLTLAFLGEVAPLRAAAAADAARSVQGDAHALPLQEARWWAHNRIVWVGPREAPAPLETLARALVDGLARRDFVLERRRFAAHVTLLRKVDGPCRLPALPSLDWPVTEFTLVQSALEASGPKYAVLERFALQG